MLITPKPVEVPGKTPIAFCGLCSRLVVAEVEIEPISGPHSSSGPWDHAIIAIDGWAGPEEMTLPVSQGEPFKKF